MTEGDKKETIVMLCVALIILVSVSPICWENHQTELEPNSASWQVDSVPDYHSLTYEISPQLADLIWTEASQAGIPARIAFQLVETESAFDPSAVSPMHAYGLAQVRLPTAREYNEDITVEQLMDEQTNLRLGFQYLADLRVRFGNWQEAAMSYHRGPTRLVRERQAGHDHGTSHAYARRVLR